VDCIADYFPKKHITALDIRRILVTLVIKEARESGDKEKRMADHAALINTSVAVSDFFWFFFLLTSLKMMKKHYDRGDATMENKKSQEEFASKILESSKGNFAKFFCNDFDCFSERNKEEVAWNYAWQGRGIRKQ
jgi:hypothetical protein